jgi:hypothetical protein
MIGRSEAWLSQVERGIRHVDRVSVLIRLAQVLSIEVWRSGHELAFG